MQESTDPWRRSYIWSPNIMFRVVLDHHFHSRSFWARYWPLYIHIFENMAFLHKRGTIKPMLYMDYIWSLDHPYSNSGPLTWFHDKRKNHKSTHLAHCARFVCTIPWVLTWLAKPQGHQQTGYGSYRISRPLFSPRKEIHYLCHQGVEIIEMQMRFVLFSTMNSRRRQLWSLWRQYIDVNYQPRSPLHSSAVDIEEHQPYLGRSQLINGDLSLGSVLIIFLKSSLTNFNLTKDGGWWQNVYFWL